MLLTAHQVGGEYCWPADEVDEVIDRLAGAQFAILGLELWELDSTGNPRVVGWTNHEVDLSGSSWEEIVERSRALAHDNIRGHLDDPEICVNIQWVSKAQWISGTL